MSSTGWADPGKTGLSSQMLSDKAVLTGMLPFILLCQGGSHSLCCWTTVFDEGGTLWWQHYILDLGCSKYLQNFKVGMGTYEVLCGELIPALQQQYTIISALLLWTKSGPRGPSTPSQFGERKVPGQVTQRKGKQKPSARRPCPCIAVLLASLK